MIAEKSNRSPHAMMLEMLEKSVTAQEQRQDFVDSALVARVEFARTRMGFEPDEIFAYFDARIKGLKPAKPKPKKWPR